MVEVVIKISDEVFEAYKHWDENKVATVEQTLIAHGTVLPKGHGRLVDENPVIAHLVYRDHLIADNVKCGEVAKIFDNAVVIEADKER